MQGRKTLAQAKTKTSWAGSLKNALTPVGGWVQAGQREKALAVTRQSPPGSVGAAIHGTLDTFTSKVGSLCAGDIGDYYAEHRTQLSRPATRANIEAFTGPETEHFQNQPGCARSVGAVLSAKDRADMVEASAQGRGLGSALGDVARNKARSGWDAVRGAVGGLFGGGSGE